MSETGDAFDQLAASLEHEAQAPSDRLYGAYDLLDELAHVAVGQPHDPAEVIILKYTTETGDTMHAFFERHQPDVIQASVRSNGGATSLAFQYSPQATHRLTDKMQRPSDLSDDEKTTILAGIVEEGIHAIRGLGAVVSLTTP